MRSVRACPSGDSIMVVLRQPGDRVDGRVGGRIDLSLGESIKPMDEHLQSSSGMQQAKNL